MISFKQDDKFIELPKKLNVAPSQSMETIPNEDFHFYRFYIEENDLLSNNVSEENDTVEECPKVQEDINDPLTNFRNLMSSPDMATAPFIQVKMWALLHMYFKTGVDLYDLLQMKIKDFNLEQERFMIVHSWAGPNSRQLSFSLHSSLVPIMKKYLVRRKGEPEDYLFCNEQGRELSLTSCKSQIGRALRHNNLSNYTLEELSAFYQQLF